MKALLDTHCWLWSAREPARLNRRARETIDAAETELLLSVASIWEITIKYQIGRLPLPRPPEQYIPEITELQGVITLPILPSHVYRTRHLRLFTATLLIACSSPRR